MIQLITKLNCLMGFKGRIWCLMELQKIKECLKMEFRNLQGNLRPPSIFLQ